MNHSILPVMLITALSLSALEVTELKSFRPFPPCADREAWNKAAEQPEIRAFREAAVKRADELLKEPVPALSTIRYMDFVRNGDRKQFEKQYLDRRYRLAALVLAECFTGKGRYLDMIAEYLCAIEGEYTWCIPAHVYSENDPLPCLEHEVVDLFSSDTVCQLALTLELLEPELTKISPNLIKRMKKILYDRSINAVESSVMDNYLWMTGRHNWTPWVISNLLWSANYLFKDDSAHLTAFAKRLMPGLERYRAKFPEDGCCNEGPNYWGVSVIRYFLDAEFFYRASEGKINIFGDPKMRRMGEYICGPWIHRNCYVPFSDNNLKVNHQYGMLRAMGQRINSVPMQILAARAQKAVPFTMQLSPCNLLGCCFEIFTPRMKSDVPDATEDKLIVFPKTEQLFCRRGKQFFAVKGGSNGEPHNHLDVGQFFFASGEHYIVIDPGSTVYDRATFSSGRYSQWCRNSTGHNPMLFSGTGQAAGAEAKTASFKVDGTNVSMDLTPVYPAEAGLTRYTRELRFDGAILQMQDKFQAKKAVRAQLRFYSLLPQLPLREKVTVKVEKIAVTDSNLLAGWGDTLYLHCIELPESDKGEITLTFDPSLIICQ